METKTVTITIENVPEELLKEFWRLAIKRSRKDVGVPIERTENMKVDFNLMDENLEIMDELFSAAVTGYIAYTANNIFNQ